MKTPEHFPSQRFDFGVPLEDIFSLGQIHPRLRFLFDRSYETAVTSGLSAEEILSNAQESLVVRLELKEKIVYGVCNEKRTAYAPGTYLWVIRHFLGLLPVPLIPKYSNKISFQWEKLSNQCFDCLKYGKKNYEESCVLDCFIVECLGFIPIEHLALLNYLMMFLRKISKISASSLQMGKRNLLTIAKYFCGSIFTRPYRPGHAEKKMLPFLTYLLLKWHNIRDLCSDTGVIKLEHENKKEFIVLNTKIPEVKVIENNNLFRYEKKYVKDTSSQTKKMTILHNSSQTSPQHLEKLSVIPYAEKLNETYSQTDSITLVNKSTQTTAQKFVDDTPSTLNDVSNLNETYPLANSTAIFPDDSINEKIQNPNNDEMSFFTAPDVSEKYYSIPNARECSEDDTNNQSSIHDVQPRALDNTHLLDETSFCFFSASDQVGSKSAKKLEEYIYDDYDTFSNEKFNQLLETNSLSVPEDQNSGWKCGNFKQNRRSKKTEDDLRNPESSYIKFDEVDDIILNSNNNISKAIINDDNSDRIARSGFNSDEQLYRSSNEKSSIYMETRSKINFGLKRFKIKMNFLRLRTPRNTFNKSPKSEHLSTTRYEKMKYTTKANTL